MQILIGFGPRGDVRHTEITSALRPLQMMRLAKERAELFAQIEVWEEAVCVLRYPPLPFRDPPALARVDDARSW